MTTITANFMNNANVTNINAQLFEGVMNNVQKIGNKYFACIYTCLLASDTTYQRDDDVNPRKLKRLADNWEDDLCDPIQVSPHPEENKFYVYEGMHRTIVQINMGRNMVVCEINMAFANMEPEARRKAEARLFAKQYDCVDRLTIMQRHKVNVLLNVPEDVYIHELCLKYGINDDKTGIGNRSKVTRTLTGMSAARRLAKSKENYLAETFEVVCNCGWADEGTGFMGHVLYAFEHIFATHPDRTELIIETLVDWLRPRANGKDDSGINEKDIRDKAREKYKSYEGKSLQMALYMEDYLHEKIKLPYRYTGNGINANNKILLVRKGA